LVLWEWLRVQGWTLTSIHKKETWINLVHGLRRNWLEVLIISLIPLGMLAYIFFLQHNFQRPLAFIEVQSAWGRQIVGPIAVIKNNIAALMQGEVNKGWLTRFWNMTSLLTFLLIVPFIWIKFGEGYAIFVLIMMLVPSASAVGSIFRYVLGAFPAFMLFGWWGRREVVDRTLILSFAVLLGVFVAIFVNWIFVA